LCLPAYPLRIDTAKPSMAAPRDNAAAGVSKAGSIAPLPQEPGVFGHGFWTSATVSPKCTAVTSWHHWLPRPLLPRRAVARMLPVPHAASHRLLLRMRRRRRLSCHRCVAHALLLVRIRRVELSRSDNARRPLMPCCRHCECRPWRRVLQPRCRVRGPRATCRTRARLRGTGLLRGACGTHWRAGRNRGATLQHQPGAAQLSRSIALCPLLGSTCACCRALG